ncbi:MAG: hypothetical protein LHW45_10420 [Candidatus Cloacimonetes bacterium]|jgi:hypothetical protein|uniref:hypothetical protein n=1 Tax=Desulfuromonas thiophila TaxID=57664 RepID=UPI002440BA22|nr:hypothetical protein [Desulfuromonas thiophila]MCB5285986.1 hypothetical protein [Candidatus Cloacimonadota bacterium]MDY0368024.1 hypothetical protein [Candidatus Syntrophosphaera sp.]
MTKIYIPTSASQLPQSEAPISGKTSAQTAKERFATPQAALKYSSALIHTRRHKRECTCIGASPVPSTERTYISQDRRTDLII